MGETKLKVNLAKFGREEKNSYVAPVRKEVAASGGWW